ncbi:hypothetical protein N0V90_006982 [Kalmusia sp. IMI 367209]|nr:hypothetical protein N0V90_006982 [Kalmusia sp. IMI 367209]
MRAFALDASDAAAVRVCADEVAKLKLAGIQVLANNASASSPKMPLTDSKPAEYWAVNFKVSLKRANLFLNAFLFRLKVATANTKAA